MALKKNDIIELKITDFGADGEGIGHYDDAEKATSARGFAVFVKNAVPGDVILAHVTKVNKNYCYAFIEKLLHASDWRVEPACAVAKQCGGCSLLHIDYEKQLAYKQEKVCQCLTRIGGFSDVTAEPIIGMEHPYEYRNKALFPVGRDKNGEITIGFYAKHSHEIVNTTECAIQERIHQPILKEVRAFLKEYNIAPYEEQTQKGLVRHIFIRVGFATKEVMVCLVINGTKLPHGRELAERITTAVEQTKPLGTYRLVGLCLNVNTEKTNVILGAKILPVWGQTYITDTIGSVRYRISPLSFYQVNPVQTKKLYELVMEYAGLSGKETVWDLYCGIGTISLFLAQKAKQVYGIEIVPEAIEDAKQNALLNHINNVEFFTGAAEDALPLCKERAAAPADVIVLDPPRAGCDEKLLQTVLSMAPKRLVYVSCDPATLARDLKVLCANGYALQRVRAVDQFCHTGHVETVVLMSKVR